MPRMALRSLSVALLAAGVAADDRISILVGNMTTEEKYAMLNGVGWPTDGDDQYDNMEGYYIGNVPRVARLGIPSLNMQDAGQGFRTSSASMVGQVTSWSCGLGLASSWDAALVEEWASAAADEFKAKKQEILSDL